MKKLRIRKYIMPLVALSCTLFYSHLMAQQRSGTSIVITPSSEEVDLGSGWLNEFSSPQSITITVKPFNWDYTIKFINSEGNDFYPNSMPYFSEVSDGIGEATAKISFHPHSVGKKIAFIVLYKYDEDYNEQEIKRVRLVATCATTNEPILKTDYATLEYGRVNLNKTKTLYLNVTSLQSRGSVQCKIVGKNSSEFLVKNPLVANHENKLEVSFTPTTEGKKNASLVIMDGNVRKIIPIIASGNKPQNTIIATPAKISFPDTKVNSLSAPSEVKLMFQNITGKVDATIIGSNATDFKIDDSINIHGDNGRLKVRFCPSKIGKRIAILRITTSDGAECSVPLEGEAIGGETEITATPNELNFGVVQLNEYTTANCQISIKNSSLVPQLLLEGPDKDLFTIITTPKAKIFTLTVGLVATRGGTLSAKVKVLLDGKQITIPITANVKTGEPSIVSNKTTITFDETVVGNQSAEKGCNLTLKNIGGNIKVSIIGNDKTQFIPSKQSISNESDLAYIGVTFKPTSEGEKHAKLVLQYEQVTVVIELSGKAKKADIKLTALPETINFGEVNISNKPLDAAGTVTIENSNELAKYTIQGRDKDFFSVNGEQQNNTLILYVQLTPKKIGELRAEIIVSVENKSITIPILATVTSTLPAIIADYTKLNFPETIVGNSSTPIICSVSSTNLEDDINLSITGEDKNSFTISKTTLPKNEEETSFEVTFTPVSTGKKQATIILTSGATTLSIPLSGHGITNNSVEIIEPLTQPILVIYNVQGQKLSSLKQGVNLVIYSNGMVRKIHIK